MRCATVQSEDSSGACDARMGRTMCACALSIASSTSYASENVRSARGGTLPVADRTAESGRIHMSHVCRIYGPQPCSAWELVFAALF